FGVRRSMFLFPFPFLFSLCLSRGVGRFPSLFAARGPHARSPKDSQGLPLDSAGTNAASDLEIGMMSARNRNSGDATVQIEQREQKRDQWQQPRRGRKSDREMPRGDYAALVALFNGLLATSLLAHKCSREPLPERVEPKDL